MCGSLFSHLIGLIILNWWRFFHWISIDVVGLLLTLLYFELKLTKDQSIDIRELILKIQHFRMDKNKEMSPEESVLNIDSPNSSTSNNQENSIVWVKILQF